MLLRAERSSACSPVVLQRNERSSCRSKAELNDAAGS
jgi:hypothetical protein